MKKVSRPVYVDMWETSDGKIFDADKYVEACEHEWRIQCDNGGMRPLGEDFKKCGIEDTHYAFFRTEEALEAFRDAFKALGYDCIADTNYELNHGYYYNPDAGTFVSMNEAIKHLNEVEEYLKQNLVV